MKKYLFLFLLLLLGKAYATHIVGGFISYRHISGTTYEVTLTIYRDCLSNTPFDGAPGATTDAIVGVFENNNTFPAIVLQLNNPVVNPISPPANPCLQISTNVCVEQGVYTQTVTLPSSTSGYTLVYERCCRNGTISNVFDPGNQGAVYTAYIPPTNTYNNTSPVFNALPPLFICVNSPLVFNYSATDADGDVLRYSLCTPYNGASATNPAPNPPSAPPFQNIPWQSPYNQNNLLGGIPLTIDSIGGVLTGTPNAIGQFVVGVCVSEYRNGQLIATYLRDYQFNVTQCNGPIANIPSSNINPNTGIGTYTAKCKTFTINFNNTSYNPPPTGVPLVYSWDFGVPGINTDTSSQQFPTYTYPDTGTYLVTLVAQKSGGSCADTTYAWVKIFPTFDIAFNAGNVCADSAVNFADAGVSTYGVINRWEWYFGDGGSSMQQNTTHQYAQAGSYNVTFVSENSVGCIDTLRKVVSVYPLPTTSFTYGPTCVNSPVNFTYTGNATAWNWDFGNGSTLNTQNPGTTYTAAGNYTVTLALTSPQGCRDTGTQTLTVHPLPTVTVTNDTTICPYSSSVQLTASGGNSYVWSPPTGLSDANIANPVATPPPPNAITYTVQVTDQFQCVNSDSVRISFHPIVQVEAGPDTSVCLNPGSFRDSVQLNASNVVSYQWTPATGLTSTTIRNPVARPAVNTLYYVLGTDINGCQSTDSVSVFVLDPSLNILIDNEKTICERDTVYINAVNQGASSYTWSPGTFLTNPAIYNPGFFPTDTTLYVLRISNYCYTKNDSVLINVNPLPVLSIPDVDSICNGDVYQFNATGAQTYQWNADPTLSATNIPNPTANPTVTNTYYLTGTSPYGCINRDSTLLLVYYPSALQLYPDTPFICLGTSVQLLVTGAYTYQWRPHPTLSATNVANPVATPTDTTEYWVEATNVHGCKSQDSLVINVQLPVTAITESPFNACRGVPLQLNASGGLYYHWTPETGLNNPFINQPFAMPDSSTSYIVKVSNDCFDDTAVAEVIVHQLPFVDAGPDTLIWRDTYATLHGYTPEATHFWQPSTWLDDPYDLNTLAEPQQTTWYELFAIDAYGCLNIDSVLITVEPYTVLDIPTAFSPNGDGMNDVFRIARWLNIENLEEFAVFNRWGNKVFSTTNIAQGWDGTFKSVNCDLGVYVWVVIARTKENDKIIRKGNVTLLR